MASGRQIPREHPAEGTVCALSADRDPADGAAADRGRLRLHATARGIGGAPFVGGVRARHRRYDRPLSGASARRGRQAVARDWRRAPSHGCRVDAAAGAAAADASHIFRRAGSADPGVAHRAQRPNSRAVLGRRGRPLRTDGDSRRSRLRRVAFHHAAKPRLRRQRAHFHSLDARRVDRPVGRGDPVSAQSNSSHPAFGGRRGGLRERPRSRISAARRTRGSTSRLCLHRDEAAHRTRRRTAHDHAERRQPRSQDYPHAFQAVARDDRGLDGNRAAATGRRRNAGDAGRLSGVRARRWRRADDADEPALDARGTARRRRASWRRA